MKQKQGLCVWPEYQGQVASIHQAAEKMPSCNLLRLPALRPVCGTPRFDRNSDRNWVSLPVPL